MEAKSQTDTARSAHLAEVEPSFFAQHNGSRYRTPIDLQITPDEGLRFLVLGGCLAEAFPQVASMMNRAFRGDFVLLNNFDSLPELPAAHASQYDFQIVHIPLRTILGNAYFRLPDDGTQHEEFLRQTEDYLRRYLSNVLSLNVKHKLTTFVLGFLVPQQNPLGRFEPRYDLRNVMHFIERLNMFLAAEVGRIENAHFVDVDQIASSIGKKACQDDMVWSYTHGTTLSDGDHDYDLNRLEPPAPMHQHYSARWLEYFEAFLHELFAMHRTLRQQDAVKLVVVDLDDTMWRGVAAEGSLGVMEGWPMGFLESLLYLKKRGLLLAIVSKNNEEFIVSRWNQIVQGQIALTDFAARKINFRSKADNLAEILQEMNLRPENAVMIDDNSVERAAIEAALPGVRVLGRHLYYLKRILLWSSETERAVITHESARKTEMVRAQLERETIRKQVSHDEFLQTLRLGVTLSVIRTTKDLNMNRALELFNKTNQFNTTGERYTLEQCHRFFECGRELYVVHAEDRFTQYGLVGAAWVDRNCVEHFVLSCRVLGLGIEESLLAHLASRMVLQNGPVMLGRLKPTDANTACRQLYSRNGFEQTKSDATFWSRTLTIPFLLPAHIGLIAPRCDEVHSGGNRVPMRAL